MAINLNAEKDALGQVSKSGHSPAVFKAIKILAAAAVFLIVMTALGVGIYDNIQKIMNRPGTATQEARKALEAHDLAKFNQYVDTDALIDRAATQILTEQINSSVDPTAYSIEEIHSRYENQLKPDFVQSARAALEEYIKTGKVTYPATLTAAQDFLKQSGAASCEIKSFTKPKLEGHAQYSTVMFYNEQMNFSFELELELREDPDGNWRIVDAKGFDSYYAGWRRALRKRLVALNTPIGQQMDEIFLVKSFRVESAGGDEYGFSKNLNIAIKADVKSDKPLDKVVGHVILGKGDRESIAPFEIDMLGVAQGVQTFNVTKTLNPFVKTDSDAMKHGLRRRDIRIEVTEIVFADGTNLKLLDRLPD